MQTKFYKHVRINSVGISKFCVLIFFLKRRFPSLNVFDRDFSGYRGSFLDLYDSIIAVKQCDGDTL